MRRHDDLRQIFLSQCRAVKKALESVIGDADQIEAISNGERSQCGIESLITAFREARRKDEAM